MYKQYDCENYIVKVGKTYKILRDWYQDEFNDL